MTAHSSREDGQLKTILGKTRCGKTSLAHEIMAGVPRILAWDPQGQIGMGKGFTNFKDLHSLVQHLQRNEENSDPDLVAFQFGTADQFDAFCKIAYAWGVQGACLVVVDEVGQVVQAGHAPPGWLRLVSAGLKYGINILAMTQRPQRLDKDTMDNSTELVIFQLTGTARGWVEKRENVPGDRIPTEKYTYHVRRDDEWSGPHKTKAI